MFKEDRVPPKIPPPPLVPMKQEKIEKMGKKQNKKVQRYASRRRCQALRSFAGSRHAHMEHRKGDNYYMKFRRFQTCPHGTQKR
jgi:hypothetical protein